MRVVGLVLRACERNSLLQELLSHTVGLGTEQMLLEAAKEGQECPLAEGGGGYIVVSQ
jgi:hypothetical protein